MRKVLLSITVFLIMAVAIGCGSDSSSGELQSFRIPLPGGKAPIRYSKEVKVGPSGLAGSEPKPVFPKGPAPEFLSLVDLIEGVGKIHHKGDPITVQYVGYDYETHKKFASSWDEGKPFSFTPGKGEAIAGWEEGLTEMETGDRRELVVPPSETSGPFPKGIPKGHAAIFVVDLLPAGSPKTEKAKGEKEGTAKPAQEPAKSESSAKKTKPKVTVPSGPPPKKLEVKDLEKGSGTTAKSGDRVSVNYVGVNYKTGKEFDSSWSRGKPFTFTLGIGEVIPGWDQGVEGMKVGGRRELIIPSQLGYGAAGAPPAIPPNEALVFVVDLEAIE